jgi:cytochrome bd-type quinol oxidase subunit 2
LFVPVVIGYQIWVYRIFRHKITQEEVEAGKAAY